MIEVKNCDLRCPKKTMMGLRYRYDQARQSNLLGSLITSVDGGLRGVGQLARVVTTCSSRNLPDGQWSASLKCIAEAQAIADSMAPVDRCNLTVEESAKLSAVRLRNDPRSITE